MGMRNKNTEIEKKETFDTLFPNLFSDSSIAFNYWKQA